MGPSAFCGIFLGFLAEDTKENI
uniref:Uncharacterized protein n=1 Tax=Anguilla anguilla TaxID=7936 RepID=A0A0E9V603_ANGAN